MAESLQAIEAGTQTMEAECRAGSAPATHLPSSSSANHQLPFTADSAGPITAPVTSRSDGLQQLPTPTLDSVASVPAVTAAQACPRDLPLASDSAPPPAATARNEQSSCTRVAVDAAHQTAAQFADPPAAPQGLPQKVLDPNSRCAGTDKESDGQCMTCEQLASKLLDARTVALEAASLQQHPMVAAEEMAFATLLRASLIGLLQQRDALVGCSQQTQAQVTALCGWFGERADADPAAVFSTLWSFALSFDQTSRRFAAQ